MFKMFWNKLNCFRKSALKKFEQFKAWFKTRRGTLHHGLILEKSSFLSFMNKVRENLKAAFLNFLFDSYYGMRLLKLRTLMFGYFVCCGSIVGAMLVADSRDYAREFLHPSGVNESVIGMTTILLALLIPVAIALIEDAKESALARQTVVKSIIRFRVAPLVLLFICFFFFIPQGIIVTGNTLTIRNIYGAVIGGCILFILMSFYRSYRWLSDGSTYSAGTDTPPEEGPQPEAFTSYRFAQVVRLLVGSKGFDTWFVIWSQWFPPDYENSLHAAFFQREEAILSQKQTKRYIYLSLEVEAYDKYFDKRNKDDWRFYLEYIERFLLLYSGVTQAIDADRTHSDTRGLWRAKSALERIIGKLIKDAIDRNRADRLFEAMDKYLAASDLLMVDTKKRPRDSIILNNFINEYLESLFTDNLEAYHIDYYFKEPNHWQVTYDNLYITRYNVSFLMEMKFKDWLFKKLDESKDKDGLYKVDSILKLIFPEADPITLADMYWLLYQVQSTTDSKLIVKMHYEEARPFGLVGRSSTYWVDEEADRMKNFAKFQGDQEGAAIKLFATMYSTYFLRFWKLDELIKVAKNAKRRKLEERQMLRLNSLIRRLTRLKNFYADVGKSQAKPKNKKGKKKV